jgi:hypothetical protein
MILPDSVEILAFAGSPHFRTVKTRFLPYLAGKTGFILTFTLQKILFNYQQCQYEKDIPLSFAPDSRRRLSPFFYGIHL